MQKITVKTFFVIAAAVALTNAVFADIRIRFPKGSSTAVVNGRISRGGKNCYFVPTRAGQVLTASVTAKNGKVVIFESGEKGYELESEHGGNESVCVDNLGGPAAYTLTVSLR